MTKPLILILTASLLASCATSDHYAAQRDQIAAWERVEVARAQANAKRFDALTVAARDGSDVARIAVAFAVTGIGGQQTFPTQLPIITDPAEGAYRWASLILPTATAITAGYFGYKLGSVQSNNSARMTEASYGAIGQGFGSNTAIAGYIQAPAPNNTTTTTTTNTSTNTLSGTGVLGSGSYAVRNCNGGIGGYTTTGGTPGSAAGGVC